MGAWGSGLYANDFALDLRAAVAAVARLPLADEELLRLLMEAEPGPAGSPDDPDHDIFWLAVAQQFARRGIQAPQAAGTAQAVIARLLPEQSDRKRRAELEGLAREIGGEPARRIARKTLKAPQPFLFETGDAFAFPVQRGRGINPYFPTERGRRDFIGDGWAIGLIARRGRAFGFLAWYTPLMLFRALPAVPALAGLPEAGPWSLGRPGTFPRTHLDRMQVAPLGRLAPDEAKLVAAFGPAKDGRSAAVADVSMCNSMHVAPASDDADPRPRALQPTRVIARLADILA